MKGRSGRLWFSWRQRFSSGPPAAERDSRRRTDPSPAPSPARRRLPRPHIRSVAGQVFLLQAVLIVLLIIAATIAVVLQAQRDAQREARARTAAVAETFASAPGVTAALSGPDPTAALQPITASASRLTGVDYLIVVGPDGNFLTNPDPARIGLPVGGDVQRFIGGGRTQTTIHSSAGGRSVVTSVPVRDAQGRGLGVVAAGLTVSRVNDTVNRQMPVVLIGATGALALAAGGTALVSRRLRRQTHGLGPAEMTRMYEHHDAVLHAVREGVVIADGEGRLVLVNDEARRLLDLPPDAVGRHVSDLRIDPALAELVASDRSASDAVYMAGDRLLAVNKRPTAPYGGVAGSVLTLRDSTELQALAGRAESTGRRLRLLYEAGVRIGTTLDVVRTAEELAEVAVPRFADFVTVELLDQVMTGEEPPAGAPTRMRRVAAHGVRADAPLYPVGEHITFGPTTPMAMCITEGHPVLQRELGAAAEWWAQDPPRAQRVIDYGIHSLITVPLQARGVVLGIANFWRAQTPGPFGEDDVAFAGELSARAAVSIDNARRFTREHAMAITLQRSLLPRGLPEQDAVDVAYRYLPAEAGVGGDWFDVIPLSGARVALVVGDVVGHGLHAAATMGRLRTAVHNFSALDLPPDELLGHLDDLVTLIDQERTSDDTALVTGATCLYAIYDPATGCVALARAGHPGPAVVTPDGGVTFPETPVSPPLGLGGSQPIETVELKLPEASRLVLFTDGLIEDRTRDLDVGFDLLRDVLKETGPGATPEQTVAAVVDGMLPPRPADDIAVLVARTRLLDPGRVVTWDVPSDPASVAPLRAACARQLDAWGLGEAAFSTELILSELVTNAIRYGAEPIRVRLMHDRALICEVSDASSTSPHLGRAAATDEGGRGLFLVAKFTARWGTRYTPDGGKVIWAEQSLGDGMGTFATPDPADVLLDAFDDSGW